MKTFIKSFNIFCDSESEPFSGYLLLQNEKILQIFHEKDFDVSLLSGATFFDFNDFYIIPGLIDINVHLNSNYDEEWNDIENVTKMAAQGGITTIIDNPIMNNYDEKFNEIDSINRRIDKIQGNLVVDCGLFGLLSTHNYRKSEEIWDSGKILGFKMYLSPNLQYNVPNVDSSKHDLKKITEFIQKNYRSEVFLAVHPESASSRDFFMCSPLRGFAKEKRLDLTEELKDSDKFGGGIPGEMDNAEDSNKESSEEDEKGDSVADLINVEQDPRTFDKITSGTLKLRSKNAAELQDQRAIHIMEMMGYSFNEEENDVIQANNDSDSELNKTKNSSDEEPDGEEEKFMSASFRKKSGFSKRITTKPEIELKKKSTLEIELKKKSTLEINKMFKDRLRTAIFMTIPQTTENEDLPLVNGVNGDNIKIMSRNSEHIENDDKKKEKRQSSLLMRRNTSRNISTKSVDLALSPSTPKKEEFNKLKNTAQNLSYKMFLMNHYVAWEINGSKQILNNFKKNSQIKVLISNISTPSAAFLVRNAKKKTQGLSIYCETSVPYLFFHSNMIRAGECKFKGSPPIRDNENRNLLIVGLNVKDLFHCVSSFHMQVPTEYKKIDKGNFKRCFNGFSIIGFNLQVVWTKLYGPLKIKFEKQPNEPVLKEKINHTMKNIIKLMCENPAEMLGLNQKKGKIKEGFDADFVVWNPFKIEEIKDDMIHLKYKKIFLLRNYKVFGKVENTFLRGKCVFSRKQGGQSVFEKKGEIIFRK